MIDASRGFTKDGNKNRLREQDIHKIVDVFNKQLEIPKYSRLVSFEEIADPKNDFNLNIPRYIDSQIAEDVQDIAAHLLGGIPEADIADLENYWVVYPSLRNYLFSPARKGYVALNIAPNEVKKEIFSHPEFVQFSQAMNEVFADWKHRNTALLKDLQVGFLPKKLIHTVSEDLLLTYTNKALLDKYDAYQHLMSYWNDTMQDDCYIIAADGWIAEPQRIMLKNKITGKETYKGWECDLVPKYLVINRYFLAEKQAIDTLVDTLQATSLQIQELEEEHSTEEGHFGDLDKISKATVSAELKIVNEALKKDKHNEQLIEKKKVCELYLNLCEKQTELNKKIRLAEAKL
ncbi:MAG: N-6 DNA methylase, partial [Thermoflexibacteraceae bacterium]